MKRLLFVFLIFLLSFHAYNQVALEPTSNLSIYAFLDELASLKIISLNSAVQPYSRTFIGSCLDSAALYTSILSRRQQKELVFYRRAYALETHQPVDSRINIFRKSRSLSLALDPYGLVYRDTLLSMQIQPILGGQVFYNNNGNVVHRWYGASVIAYAGKHLGIYASLRDNWETQILTQPRYFTLQMGGNYKVKEGGRPGGDYSEMRGGISWAWKWGYIGLIKDQVIWGSGYHGSIILSGRTPTFPYIRLNLKPAAWVELNYIHGWLVSEVIDSSRSFITPQGTYRAVYRNKFLAANFITITPAKYVNISLGNSIIYSDMNIQPAFLIPLMFYKSIDHTLDHGIDNQNSQMFLDLSIRSVKHLHLYGSLFVDEWKTSRLFQKDQHNFVGGKAGFRLSGWPVHNFSLTAEYTRINPITYKHRIPSLTYASNQYNLGYYLGDNSDEWYLSASLKPVRGLDLSVSAWHARHGNEYVYDTGLDATTHPVLQNITWQNKSISLKARYEFLSNAYLFGEILFSKIQSFDVDGKSALYYLNLFTPKLFQGNQSTISGGFAFGF